MGWAGMGWGKKGIYRYVHQTSTPEGPQNQHIDPQIQLEKGQGAELQQPEDNQDIGVPGGAWPAAILVAETDRHCVV